MNEGFYLPLDSIITPIPPNAPTMETSRTSIPEWNPEKLHGVEANVTEIDSDIPTTPEFDRLTMRNPVPQHQPVTFPHPHHEPAHLPKSPEIITCYPDIKVPHFPRPSSPTGSIRSVLSSRRHVSRGSRWSGGFKRSHHSTEVSRQLTAQAESEFFALTELISNFSRKSSSLKEVWTKIMAERESCDLEIQRMHEHYESWSETIEREKKEQHSHKHEVRLKCPLF
jgi:hypothetical protein